MIWREVASSAMPWAGRSAGCRSPRSPGPRPAPGPRLALAAGIVAAGTPVGLLAIGAPPRGPWSSGHRRLSTDFVGMLHHEHRITCEVTDFMPKSLHHAQRLARRGEM